MPKMMGVSTGFIVFYSIHWASIGCPLGFHWDSGCVSMDPPDKGSKALRLDRPLVHCRIDEPESSASMFLTGDGQGHLQRHVRHVSRKGSLTHWPCDIQGQRVLNRLQKQKYVDMPSVRDTSAAIDIFDYISHGRFASKILGVQPTTWANDGKQQSDRSFSCDGTNIST